MQQKLSAMYRGMRGLEAAHAAFAMCQVNINVDVEDVAAGPSNPAQRGKRAFKGKSGNRGAKSARKHDHESRDKAETGTRVEKKKKAKKTASTVIDEGEMSEGKSIAQLPSAEGSLWREFGSNGGCVERLGRGRG